jgi:anti-sigma regulatory factor (Ser/Thr protein kinase)
MGNNESSIHMRLACDQQAPGTVREAMSQLRGLESVAGDAMLVASELVSNAVRHSLCDASDQLQVDVRRESDRVCIRVHDPGVSGQEARVPDPGQRDFGGLGLWIVEQLTSRWGTERRDGYEVWAELSLPSSRRARAARMRPHAL